MSNVMFVDGISSVRQVAASDPWHWSYDVECSLCHEAEACIEQSHLVGIHAEREFECGDCHADAAALTAAHEGGVASNSQNEVAVDDDMCEECHEPTVLVEETASSTVLTDSRGTRVNPHALPEGTVHDLSCFSCHAVHTEENDVEKTSEERCASCHHADVYECNTCHA